MIPRGINAVCELFHVTTSTTTYEGRKVHFLGRVLDQARITPLFYNREALSRFCVSVSGRAEINRRAAKLFPNWDECKAAWRD